MEQHSIEWYKARLGKITGSMVYTLMGKGRKKDEEWSETAKGYMYQLAAERNINPIYLDKKFDEWLSRTNVETWAMRYGTENESGARDCYNMNLPEGMICEECGFMQHPELPNYGDSPDGLVYEGLRLIGCVEIKCPNPATWMRYKAEFKAGKTLKEVEEKYWWQVQSHLMCSGAEWCDFIYYDKMMNSGMQSVRIEPDAEDQAKMRERIEKANEFVDKFFTM